MRRTFELGTKVRLSFSGEPHAPNTADGMEVLNTGFSEILVDSFHHLFGSRNSPTTVILHTIRHVYRSVWPAREAKPRFGAALFLLFPDVDIVIVICLTL